MYTHRRFASGLASAAVLISMTGAVASAQSITSAHSGLLHYFEGKVTVDGVAVESKAGKFTEIKENSVLRTEQGRAEILLTPGVYLRVGENSSVKMLDNRLLSTRVEFLSGSALVESDDPTVSVKDPAVTIVYKDYEVQPLKYGIFELTSEPGEMKVFKGQANIAAGSVHTVVHEGRLVVLSAALVSERFDAKQADDLFLWARDRSGALSAANLSSARSLSANGYANGYSGFGLNNGTMGNWYFNQALGSFAYLPYNGTFYSPFGYGLFSPYTISSYYSPGGYTWYGGSGARSTSFVPQPVSGTVASTTRSGSGSLAPGRLTGGLPVAGSGSSTVNLARGGFTSGLARANSPAAAAGGRFSGVDTSNNAASFSSPVNNSFSAASANIGSSGSSSSMSAIGGGSARGAAVGGGGVSVGGAGGGRAR